MKCVNKEYTENLEEIATYGLETIDSDEKVEVNLKDLLYVFSTLLEYQRFFHQPLHYKSLKDIDRFLGSVQDPKAYKLLHTSIHEKMRRMLPEYIEEKYGDGEFDSPKLPFYYDENK